ncbi:hypothetical protein ILUMI_19974, partial [Ignelater luminosus]
MPGRSPLSDTEFSQKTQSLDCIFFEPFIHFHDDEWTACHSGQIFSMYHVAEISANAFQTTTAEKPVEGFRATGTFPLDRNKFTDDDFLSAEVTDQNLEQNNDPVDPEDVALIVFDNDETHLGNEVLAN